MISDDIYDEIQYTKKNPTKADSNLSLTSFPILLPCFELLLPQHPRCPSLHKLFLLENQTHAVPSPWYTLPLFYSVPSQERDESRIIFCFELLALLASFPIHMAPIAWLLFYSHPLPDPNRGCGENVSTPKMQTFCILFLCLSRRMKEVRILSPGSLGVTRCWLSASDMDDDKSHGDFFFQIWHC